MLAGVKLAVSLFLSVVRQITELYFNESKAA